MDMQTASNVRSSRSTKCVEFTAEELIRLLVDKAEAKTGGHPPAPREMDPLHGEEILVDVDLAGERYLLVRLPTIDRPHVQLSPREQEIVRMVAQGLPNKTIADVLSISTWTVCTHLRRVFAKTGVGSRAAVVARFLETRGGIAETMPHVLTRAQSGSTATKFAAKASDNSGQLAFEIRSEREQAASGDTRNKG